MDHKSFFQDYGKFPPRDVDAEFSVEKLYQAFKQRLIEELRSNECDLEMRLIDTTEQP